MNQSEAMYHGDEIAVIGMAGRFAGARNLEEFWANLQAGVESITFLSDEELAGSGVDPGVSRHPNYVRAVSMLEEIDLFDAGFFGFSPREAEITDPQHRLMLEYSWAALENAGYNPESYPGAIGVFGGISSNGFLANVLQHWRRYESLGSFRISLGSDKDYVTTWISYKLNLRGPSVTIQTACSTSLVAVHVACQNLLMGEVSLALAGGVSVVNLKKTGYFFQPDGVLSPDGHCRAFDEQAQGTLPGNGIGMVVLKRLSEAVADGDTVHAVIKGSATNNDGAWKVGFTAPSVDGQANVISTALSMGQVDAGSIGYVEAHGTGTALGDPIEVMALTQAFRQSTVKKNFCALGSLKTNLGHLNAAAGVAGMIKAILALKHRQIPPSLHFQRPNPKIDFANSPFYVSTGLEEWKPNGALRRAGVSSFGIGGTNAHVVLEEVPKPAPSGAGRSHHLLVLSARNEEALSQARNNLEEYLRTRKGVNWADVAHTLQEGRKAFSCRGIAVVRGPHETALGELMGKGEWGISATEGTRVAFLLSGQASQFIGMGLGLYEEEEIYRTAIDQCAELLRSRLGLDIRDLILGRTPGAREQLNETEIAQPAIFAVTHAIARQLQHWGVLPQALVGHSLGEYAAATLAGVMHLEEALELVVVRGREMQRRPRGKMLSVLLSEEEIGEWIQSRELWLAAVNASKNCVVSGSEQAIARFQQELTFRSVACRELQVSHGFHSGLMDGMREEFLRAVKKIRLQEPRIPWVSSTTGRWIQKGEATNPEYWWRQIREPVQFKAAMEELVRDAENLVLLEVGPGEGLSRLVRHQFGPGRIPTLTTLSGDAGACDQEHLLNTLGRLWGRGINVNWKNFNSGQKRRRVELPSYPFQRQRYWIQSPEPQEPAQENWLAHRSWKRAAALLPSAPGTRLHWLVLQDDSPLGGVVGRQLEGAGHDVTAVRLGQFAGARECGRLIDDLASAGKLPNRVVCFHTRAPGKKSAVDRERLLRTTAEHGNTLWFLADALSRQESAGPVRIEVVTVGLHEVTGDETLQPESAAFVGVCQALRQRHPGWQCRAIDMGRGSKSAQEKMASDLMAELLTSTTENIVAHRQRYRWVPDGVNHVVSAANGRAGRLRAGGVYFLTGRLHTAAQAIAEHLAVTFKAKLIVSRSPHGAPDEKNSEFDPFLQQLKKLGGEVLEIQADLSDEREIAAAWKQGCGRFGTIDGVIHAAGVEPLDASARGSLWEEWVAQSKVIYSLGTILKSRRVDFATIVLAPEPASPLANAVNAFAEAFLQQQNRRGNTPWTGIGWDNLDGNHEAIAAAARAGFDRVMKETMVGQVTISLAHFQSRSGKISNPEATAPATSPIGERHARPDLPDHYEAPGDEIQETLVRIWEELLGIQGIGVEDSFFELGGHSLLGTQLMSRVRETFRHELPLRILFEAPTIAQMSRYIGELNLAAVRAPAAPPLVKAAPGQEIPLSHCQERLWFLHELAPKSPLYHLSSSVWLTGPLHIAAMDQAIAELMHRHESLRTAFEVRETRPVQVIHSLPALVLPFIDMRELSGVVRDTELSRLQREETARPFDFMRGPLHRVLLFQLGVQEHVISYTLHHIITDGWSMGILNREISALYQAFSTGQAPQLPEIRIQYSDFALWQRSWLQGEVLDRALGYWKEQLAGIPAALELPMSHSRPENPTYAGGIERTVLSMEFLDGLKELCRRSGTTLFMMLLSAFATLLHRYAWLPDVVIGTTIAQRERKEIEGLIGFFVNTLALRVRFSEAITFMELLKLVKETVLDAYAHQDVPFEKIVEVLQPVRSTRFSPVFQVLVELHNEPAADARVPDLKMTFMGSQQLLAQYDLRLVMRESARGLSIGLEYQTELYSSKAVQEMLGHFEVLLAAVVRDPELAVARIPLLSESTLKRMVEEWNDTRAAYPEESCFHQLFEQQVARTPEAVAVSAEDGTLTYAELNNRANQLANHLRTLGVGPETMAGIFLNRSLNLVVSLLAVLKAGGAYVPIDPSYPLERVRFLLQDAGIFVLLTQGSLEERLPAHHAFLVNMGRPESSLDGQSRENPLNQVAAENAAYVIYTSGSTGRPKGVVVTHRGLVNYLAWASTVYSVREGTGTLVHSSIGFDLTITGLFAPLLVGQMVILAPEGIGMEPLRSACTRHRNLGLVKITPAHLEVLREILTPDQARNWTRTFVIGGEPLIGETLEFWRKHSPQTRLINEYGPTETVVGCCVYEVNPGETLKGAVAIGRPIANTQLYLLDRNGEILPVGCRGEIYIGGEGVARGYLSQPALTAERFIPDRFGTRAGARLYRTGDLASYASDGSIAFIGRIDDQVKLRGYRIELGEIETVLEAHSAVEASVVIMREDKPGDRRLVAYVVSDRPNAVSADALKKHLATQLPDYMVPATLIFLQGIPLTQNGKVDRKALPSPDGARERSVSRIKPRNPIEEVLAGIWCQILKLKEVGVNEDFFVLGGHSLLATQVVSRIREAFGVEVPLNHVFEFPTLASLAQMISAKYELREDRSAVARAAAAVRIQAEIDNMTPQEVQLLWERKKRERKHTTSASAESPHSN